MGSVGGRIGRQGFGLALLAGALVLGGCGKGAEEDRSTDAGDMASKVGQGVAAPTPQPGRWETVMKLESIDLPGGMADIAPQVRARLEKAGGAGRRFATCLTADQASRPPADFFGHGRPGCRYEAFRMAEGRMEGTMTCRTAGGALKIAMSGKYSADSWEVHADSRMTGPDAQSMVQKMTLSARRAGDCKGDEVNAGTR